jgi:hypothetical protein
MKLPETARDELAATKLVVTLLRVVTGLPTANGAPVRCNAVQCNNARCKTAPCKTAPCKTANCIGLRKTPEAFVLGL